MTTKTTLIALALAAATFTTASLLADTASARPGIVVGRITGTIPPRQGTIVGTITGTTLPGPKGGAVPIPPGQTTTAGAPKPTTGNCGDQGCYPCPRFPDHVDAGNCAIIGPIPRGNIPQPGPVHPDRPCVNYGKRFCQ